jgi:hypothetical protein
MGSDWKAGFQAALTDYFYSQKFFVFDSDGGYYSSGTDYDASYELWSHLGIQGYWNTGEYAHVTLGSCEVDRAASDTVADMTEYDHSYFTDTGGPEGHRLLLMANLTCKCGEYRAVRVAIEDSLSNAIKCVTK